MKWGQITVPHPSALGPRVAAHFPGFLFLRMIVLRSAAARFVEDAAPAGIEPVDPATDYTQFAAGLPLESEKLPDMGAHDISLLLQIATVKVSDRHGAFDEAAIFNAPVQLSTIFA